MSRRSGKKPANYISTRLHNEAVNWLLRRSTSDYVVDLTYVQMDGVRRYRVWSPASGTEYVSQSALKDRAFIGARVAVLGSVSPDMFLRPAFGAVVRDEARVFMKTMLPESLVVRLYDPVELVLSSESDASQAKSDGGSYLFKQELGDRVVMYEETECQSGSDSFMVVRPRTVYDEESGRITDMSASYEWLYSLD